MITNLRKMSIVGILLGGGMLVAPLFAAAKTAAILAPIEVHPNLGEQFSIVITIDPESTLVYAEKVVVAYPADALEIVSFDYGDSWTPLLKDGYENTNEAKGTLTRTAAFPGGFSDIKTFGTITFVAKKAVAGTIHIQKGSLSYTGEGQEILTPGATQFQIVTPPAPQDFDQADLAASAISVRFIDSTKSLLTAVSIIAVLILLLAALLPKFRHHLFKLK